jgi:hypothetical protein
MVDRGVTGLIWVVWVEQGFGMSAAHDLDGLIRFILRDEVWGERMSIVEMTRDTRRTSR